MIERFSEIKARFLYSFCYLFDKDETWAGAVLIGSTIPMCGVWSDEYGLYKTWAEYKAAFELRDKLPF